MKTTPIGDVIVALNFFRSLQKKAGVVEGGNIIQHKWNMREVMDHIDNKKHVKQLIMFYFDYSDNKSFTDFFRQYDKYYETMEDVKRDRKLRKAIMKRTLEGEVPVEP